MIVYLKCELYCIGKQCRNTNGWMKEGTGMKYSKTTTKVKNGIRSWCNHLLVLDWKKFRG
jgi:hypothetical protein